MDYSKDSNTNRRGRKLTAILYLNERWEGGQLRVHIPSDALVPTAMSSLASVAQKGSIEEMQDLNGGERAAPAAATTATAAATNPAGASVPASTTAAGGSYMDIDPVMGRLVIFRRLD